MIYDMKFTMRYNCLLNLYLKMPFSYGDIIKQLVSKSQIMPMLSDFKMYWHLFGSRKIFTKWIN